MTTNQLAIHGGPKTTTKNFIPPVNIDAQEKKAVTRVLDSGELSGFAASPGNDFWGGREVKRFEALCKERFGVDYAIAVNSATSALHCAIASTGVGPGDEVIVPPLTMSATASTVLFTGAVPVFADVDEDTYCLDINSVKKMINPNTKAILAVNLFGQTANLNALKAIAKEHKLFLIEDNAQAPAALHHGQYAGTIGDLGVLSFNRHKIIQSGEGGVVLTNDKELALKCALIRNHGEVLVDHFGVTDITNMVGLNYRMTELEAAIAYEQLLKLDNLNQHKLALCNAVTEILSTKEGLSAPVTSEGNTHVYYLYAMKFHADKFSITRDNFVNAICHEGIPIRAGYVRPIYLEPLYQQRVCFGKKGYPFTAHSDPDSLNYAKGACPVAEKLHNEQVIILSFLNCDIVPEDVSSFSHAIDKVMTNQAQLMDNSETLEAS